ncbi:SinI family restriction endonuclease [Pleurocapsales cyanobacterium LEGE 10410]|nr:SinI family restriction endonuclease [Pleurocapsales cyanobacterium LEGE 10410]
MKFDQALEKLPKRQAIILAQATAQENNWQWNKDIEIIFTACCDNLDLAPQLGGKNDDEKQVIAKWISKYWNAYNQRISTRVSNPPGTVADSIVKTIIATKLSHLNDRELSKIIYAHRLSMSAENILGLLLEEYLHNNLTDYGWYFAWGDTVKSVDFCHEDGRLLQIKNRSNSENSSSNKVRSGTEIEKWHRVNARTGKYMWENLNNKYATNKFSEEDFRSFVILTIKNNPGALAIEAENLWLDRTNKN